MSGARLRMIIRVVHIVGGLLIGAFVYAPWADNAAFVLLMQVGVMPVLGISGVLLWQQARFNRFMRRVLPHKTERTPTR